jgi:ribosome-binding factor A
MTRRSERVGELIREEISDLLRREIDDPRLKTGAIISITEVEVSADLRYAKVFVSLLGSEEETKAAFASLVHAEGFFRHELGERLRLRYTPEIHFRRDESLARGARLTELLRQVEQQEASGQTNDTAERGDAPKGAP